MIRKFTSLIFWGLSLSNEDDEKEDDDDDDDDNDNYDYNDNDNDNDDAEDDDVANQQGDTDGHGDDGHHHGGGPASPEDDISLLIDAILKDVHLLICNSCDAPHFDCYKESAAPQREVFLLFCNSYSCGKWW